MTAILWTGAVDGNAGTAGNYSPAQVPVSGDTLRFNTGSVSVTTGLDLSSVDLAALYIGPEYTGSIGSDSGPLRIDSAKTVIHKRTGEVHLRGDLDNVYVMNTASGPTAMSFQALGARNIDNLIILDSRGTITVQTNTIISSIYVNPRRTATLIVESGVDDGSVLGANDVEGYVALRLYGGYATVNRLGKTTRVMNRAALDIQGAAACTNMTVRRGTVRARGTNANNASKFVDGTLTLMEGAFFTMRDSESIALTIDDCITYPGAVLDTRTGARIVDFTNDITYRGGVVKVDKGTTVAV